MTFNFRTTLILVGILLSIVGVEFPAFSQEPSHKALEYEVKVNVRMVPMFAVDKKGEPVYDLTQEEMELLVNGKPFDILYFHGFKMDSREQSRITRERTAGPVPRTQMPERINFIIIDSLISNMSTLEPSRIIVNRIIAQASAKDAFVILESNQLDGFHYVAGPEKDKQKLYQVMSGIEKRFMRRRIQQKWLKHMAATTIQNDFTSHGAAEEMGRLEMIRVTKMRNERGKYQKDLLHFSKSLKQLKFALQSTPLAKTNFLITAGHVTEGMGKNPVTYMHFLEEAAKEVNRGGALFYIINPLMQGNTQHATRLKFMADAASGQMISGKTISEVVTQVRQSTSAYYEMAFSPKNQKYPSRKRYRIDVRCKRKGVTLTTITHSEKDVSYLEMKKTQRKLFVLNVINGGFWSRTLARVERVKYRTLDEAANTNRKAMEITIPLPIEMQFKKLHIFQVEIDAQTQEARLSQSSDTPGETMNMTFRPKKGKLQYFVVIDPKKPACIYNLVK